MREASRRLMANPEFSAGERPRAEQESIRLNVYFTRSAQRCRRPGPVTPMLVQQRSGKARIELGGTKSDKRYVIEARKTDHRPRRPHESLPILNGGMVAKLSYSVLTPTVKLGDGRRLPTGGLVRLHLRQCQGVCGLRPRRSAGGLVRIGSCVPAVPRFCGKGLKSAQQAVQ